MRLRCEACAKTNPADFSDAAFQPLGHRARRDEVVHAQGHAQVLKLAPQRIELREGGVHIIDEDGADKGPP